ncbi:MAG: DUF885 domain-containing protein, partial [Sphingomonas sp.]
MDRRQFLASGGVAALAATFVPAAAWAQGGDAALNAEFDRIFRDQVARQPELATSLGLDKGPMADAKRRLSPRTPAKR